MTDLKKAIIIILIIIASCIIAGILYLRCSYDERNEWVVEENAPEAPKPEIWL